LLQTLFFFSIFGALETDFALFTGRAGLSMAPNQGSRKKTTTNPRRLETKPKAVAQRRLAGEGKLSPAKA